MYRYDQGPALFRSAQLWPFARMYPRMNMQLGWDGLISSC